MLSSSGSASLSLNVSAPIPSGSGAPEPKKRKTSEIEQSNENSLDNLFKNCVSMPTPTPSEFKTLVYQYASKAVSFGRKS